MRKPILLILLALVSLNLRAQDFGDEFFSLPDTLTDAYLDSLSIPSQVKPNDYWLVGAFYGATLLHGYWNPPRSVASTPIFGAWGVSVTKYATMLNMFHMVGLEAGFQRTYEGYYFKENKETGITPNILGAYNALIDVYEGNLLMQMHFDVGEHLKLMVKGGLYGGYRTKIHRGGDYARKEFVDSFAVNYPMYGNQTYTDQRMTYGVEAGVGFAVMVDPFEIHFNALGKWGWREYHNPDYLSPYYYRFSYPFDILFQVGLHYQLTPRHGHTRAQLRKMAREAVLNENKDEKPFSQNR